MFEYGAVSPPRSSAVRRAHRPAAGGFDVSTIDVFAGVSGDAVDMPAHAVSAQGTLAGIQGKVFDDSGPLPGAAVVARDTQNGFQYEAVSAADGSFTLSGLRPGTYEITVTMPQFKPQSKTLQIQVGQSITANFKVSPDVLYTEQVQVVGNSRLVETRTSQISTTVTPEEVRYLPQNQRNFLNFAALAPGARVSNDETRKQVTGGGLDATQVNVFIDGVSFKNDVLDGGVVGQDSSRGSPFPQTAVQEFQVLTQNYKAEHEKASSLVITAVTKSGGNRWSGEGFLFYQNKDLVGNEYFAERRGDPKPTYDRFQPGVAIGGPIVRDRLQVFGSYEENRQDRSNRVFLGTTPFPPTLDFLRNYEGTFVSPFRERLFFAKLSAQPRAGQSAELTYSLRNETDIRSFGGQTSVDSAENVRNRVDSGLARWARLEPPLAERGNHHVPALELESRADQHCRRRVELRQRDAHWRARHDAGFRADAHVASRRLHALRTMARQPHPQERDRLQLPRVPGRQVPDRQPAVRAQAG